jgi:sugar-specific transcriptional regulator TrmB
MVKESCMMTATEIAQELGVSQGHAYKLIRRLNNELQNQGFVVIAGRLPRAFWETKMYGCRK